MTQRSAERRRSRAIRIYCATCLFGCCLCQKQSISDRRDTREEKLERGERKEEKEREREMRQGGEQQIKSVRNVNEGRERRGESK